MTKQIIDINFVVIFKTVQNHIVTKQKIDINFVIFSKKNQKNQVSQNSFFFMKLLFQFLFEYNM